MIRAVVGVGPRVGTSFTMRKLHEAGLPVHWDPSIDKKMPSEGNPEGYYETHFQDYRSLDNVIVKVWPLSARFADMEKMVVIERSRESQLASIEKQMVREQALLETLGIDWAPEEFLDKSAQALNLYLSIPHLRVRTEDLDERIDEIINYMRY
jgi:hypothetical protein